MGDVISHGRKRKYDQMEYNRIRCTFPIQLVHKTDHEIKAKYYGNEIFVIQGLTTSLKETGEIMNQIYSEKNNLARNMLENNIEIECWFRDKQYYIPWHIFLLHGTVTPQYIEISSELCDKSHRLLERHPFVYESRYPVYQMDESDSESMDDTALDEEDLQDLDYPDTELEDEQDASSDIETLNGSTIIENLRNHILPTRASVVFKKQEIIPYTLKKEKCEESCCADSSIASPWFHFKERFECGICGNDGKVLWDVVQKTPASLGDLPKFEMFEDSTFSFPNDVLLMNPCHHEGHITCVGCIRRIILDRTHPPIHRKRAAIFCMSLGGECEYIYQPHWFEWIVDSSSVAYIQELYQRYMLIGYEKTKCPLLVGGQVCNADCLVEYESIDSGKPGSLLIQCSQNSSCRGQFCYYCKAKIPLHMDQCAECINTEERENPQVVNRYFYNPDHSSEFDIFLLNKDITKEIAMKQIRDILDCEKLIPQCFQCRVPLYKTSMCNGLSHCGIQKCYICGKNTCVNGTLENDHWDTHGVDGCPRYDNSMYWKILNPSFECVENNCYSDHMDCTIEEHQKGIHAMHEKRKMWHVFAMANSLPRILGDSILSELLDSK